MDEFQLPSRLFELGYEPVGKKRVNNYFNLRWIELIKVALEDEDLVMLQGTQFQRILRMGTHTFSVMFGHYILSRQLITEKEFELWWLFAGKPIRYGIGDFAFVTGLNCEEASFPPEYAKDKASGRGKATNKRKGLASSSSIWEDLFGDEGKPTTGWIMDRLLQGKKYKDPLTRLRLSLLVLVEGILCPTCGSTKIRPEVVNMLANLDEFLKFPWGRQSFLLTVKSAKAVSAGQYVQDTFALQGFIHAMILVTLTACPSILSKPADVDSFADGSRSIEEVLDTILTAKLTVNVHWAKIVDQKGEVNVRSCVSSDESHAVLSRGLEDEADQYVANMVALIADDYPFEHNIWAGGVKADEVRQNKAPTMEPESSECNLPSQPEMEEQSHGGLDGGMDSHGARASPLSHDKAAHGDHNSGGVDVQGLLRLAADAYEERMMPRIEGCMLSLKTHFDEVVACLQTELASAVISIKELERLVNSLVTTRGSSFARPDDRSDIPPYHESSPRNVTFAAGVTDTSSPGEGHRTQSTNSHPSNIDKPLAEDSSHFTPPASDIDGFVLPPAPKPVSPIAAGGDGREEHANATQEEGAEVVDAETTVIAPPKENANSTREEVADVGAYTHGIRPPKENANATREEVADVGADTHVNRRTKGVVGGKAARIPPGDVGRRCSQRTRQTTKRYTPEANPKKEMKKRLCTESESTVLPAKRVKKVTISESPTLPQTEHIQLVAGFAPFTPPLAESRDAFLKTMEDAK